MTLVGVKLQLFLTRLGLAFVDIFTKDIQINDLNWGFGYLLGGLQGFRGFLDK
jgi:hypothetical protein